ncbi:hypothetical protein [Nocardia sp. NPDC050793]|uniref:hypothetical protein n=1 Tax=Nocardia sp. NPDC050793 TaxID=3155159 RepID=UPI0033F3DF26
MTATPRRLALADVIARPGVAAATSAETGPETGSAWVPDAAGPTPDVRSLMADADLVAGRRGSVPDQVRACRRLAERRVGP